MTPEEKRIAIAEACGWTKIKEQDYDHGNSGDDVRQYWAGVPPDEFSITEIPDYLNDLNSIHEAEKSLNVDQIARYFANLDEIVNYALPKAMNSHVARYAVISATANQRAEAFLKTIGKL